MLGTDSANFAVSYSGPPQLQVHRPQPAQRVVEGSEKSTLQQQHTGSMEFQSAASGQTMVARLVASARQFAAILNSTGNIQAASQATGFPVRRVDLYA